MVSNSSKGPGALRRMYRMGRATLRHMRLLAGSEPTGSPRLSPLLLTANGRSGTTLFMSWVSRHPQICAFPWYPFEHNQAAYFIEIYRVMTGQPAAELGAKTYAEICVESGDVLTRNPYLNVVPVAEPWYRYEYRDRIRHFVRDITDSYYRYLGAAGAKAAPRYFAEYVLPSTGLTDVAYEIWSEVREVLLVRDMRDLLCSVRRFNAKRGYPSFGRQLVDTEAQYIDVVLAQAARDMLSAHRKRPAALIVKYEDLVADTAAVMQSVFAYLGLDAAAEVLQAPQTNQHEFDRHRTAMDESASIGAWRRELDPTTQARCQRVFDEYLRTFGYQP